VSEIEQRLARVKMQSIQAKKERENLHAQSSEEVECKPLLAGDDDIYAKQDKIRASLSEMTSVIDSVADGDPEFHEELKEIFNQHSN
jgi:hypothetical protein